MITFPAEEHHCPLAKDQLHCLLTEAHVCEQLDRGHYIAVERYYIYICVCYICIFRNTKSTVEENEASRDVKRCIVYGIY